MTSSNKILVLKEPSGPREEWEKDASGVLQVRRTEWWGKHLPSQGENCEGQYSLGCVRYSIGKKNNSVCLASHLVLHKTKHNRVRAFTAEAVDFQP